MMLAAISLAALSLGGAAGEPSVVSLSATPARLELDAAETGAIALRNVGRSAVVVAARAGSIALDLRGRPRLVGHASARRSAASWLAVRPRDFTLAPGARAVLDVQARTPRRAEPGDHHGVILLSSRPPGQGRVGVRVRIGVRVIVHVPGKVVRKLVVRSLRVRPRGLARSLEVTVANLGNVTETLDRNRMTVTLVARGRTLARLTGERREVLPRTRAIAQAVYRGGARGWVVARVDVAGAAARTFRVRL